METKKIRLPLIQQNAKKMIIWFSDFAQPSFEQVREMQKEYFLIQGHKPNGSFGWGIQIELSPKH